MISKLRYVAVLGVSGLCGSVAPNVTQAAEGAGFDDEVLVVAPAPGAGSGLAAERLPFAVQAAVGPVTVTLYAALIIVLEHRFSKRAD